MGSFFDKATTWRRRANELRKVADRTTAPVVQTSLRDMAVALEHHAQNLEQTAIKLSRARERAAVTPLRSLLHKFPGNRRS